jgi:hypothetical protein
MYPEMTNFCSVDPQGSTLPIDWMAFYIASGSMFTKLR